MKNNNFTIYFLSFKQIFNSNIFITYYFLLPIFYIIKKKFIKIFLLLILFIISFLLLFIHVNIENEIFIYNNNKSFLKLKIIQIFNNYIKFCLENNYILKKNKFLENPKISIIMPIYNGEKYLFYSLRSIQNQKFKEIEILLIDDCSTDNSINIIKKYMNEDKRIRLIQNKKNKKILYSKSIGALNSNGKYIIELDQDDMFIRDDCIDILYLQAETNDLDLVQIRDYIKKTFYFNFITKIDGFGKHLIFPQVTNYKIQPNLKLKMFVENNNYLLWGLLIKSDIYKKAIYLLWPMIMNYQLIFHEDYSISFMIIILAKRYKYLNKFGLLHLIHEKSASNNFHINNNYYLSVLFVSNIIYNNYIKENEKDIVILINYINLFIDCFQYAKNYIPDFYNHIIKFILKSDYLNENEKQSIIYTLENNTYNENKLIEDDFALSTKKIQIEKKLIVKDIYELTILIYCNESKYLFNTIKSILCQKYIYLEIIIIYDNDNQKELSYIKSLIKNYKVIRLIDNKTKKGLIYSISIGVLKSKGNFILFLQPTYLLYKDNILNTLYNKIINNNFDILEFNLIIKSDILSKYSVLYQCPHIKSSINLESIKYNKFYKDIDQENDLLFNKLIQTNLFKNIINKFKINKFREIIYNYFHNIFLFSLKNNEANIQHLDIIGIIQYTNQMENLKINQIMKNKNQKINDTIFYINFLFEKTDNTFEGKKYALNELFNILSIICNKFNRISKDSIKLIEKFNNSKFINISDKIELNFYYNSLIN